MGVSMNSKRTYLDTLNAGRQRRPSPSLEQITQSLQNLESKLDRSRDGADELGWGRADPDPRHAARADLGFGPRYAEPARGAPYAEPTRSAHYAESARAAHYAEPARASYAEPTRAAPYAEPARPASRPAQRPAAEQPYQSIALDIDRVRVQEDGAASVSKIAGELKGLREELRQQMTTGLHREFDMLRHQIERAYASAVPTAAGSELTAEIERISHAMRHLSERSDDKSINLLRGEIDQVKRALDKLAREETVQSVDRRWDDFDRRWSDFEDRVDARQKAADPSISLLSDRLQAIGEAVNGLPESLSLRSLEDKVRTLAGAVEHFVRQQERQAPETFALIEERLDEISRAIVASTAAVQVPNFDPEPFQRIEARISALATQIEEVAEDRPTAAVIDHLHQLSRRVDELAAQKSVPDEQVERLARQIAIVADKIDRQPAGPDADALFQGIEQRFDLLSSMIERRQGDAIEHGNVMFRDLEGRLEELADRLDKRATDTGDNSRVMAAIDARFSALASQIDASNPADASNEAIRGLEDRLESISMRLDASSAQLASIDPDLIRSLEGQVSALSDHLNRPMGPFPEFEDIGPRLDDLEKSISGSRDSILEAARQAAENAVRSFNGSQNHTAAVTGLAQDMRALEELTRRSDQRNAKTFEAIHDTLIKIVDRLGALDTADAASDLDEDAAPIAAAAPKIEIAEVPSIDPDRRGPRSPAPAVDRTGTDAQPQRSRTPAEAAAAAAMAAVGTGPLVAEEPPARSKSLLGGLARAFSGKRDAVAPSAGEPTLDADGPKLDLDQPLDPRIANRPLEPGSGAPDLNAIMKRVRDERGQPQKHAEPDAAKSDFIAAARRAAQAAAAEAEVLKGHSDIAGQVRNFKFGDTLKARRKPVLMAAAAVMIALAGLQLGKAFLGSSQQGDEIASDALLAEPPINASSATAASAAVDLAGPAQDFPGDASGSEVAAASERDADPSDTVRVAGDSETVMVSDTAAAPASPATDSAGPGVTAEAPAANAQPAPVVAAVAPEAPVDAAPIDTATTAAANPSAAIGEIPVEAGPVALREAAAEGDAKALFEVGSRYADGRGVTADLKQAAKWYERSAELGFAPSQYRIGNFFEKGLGVERDIAKAKTWYQLAATQGNASAMHNLAVLFAMGADGTADNESAARWFTMAADLGVKDSQFNLGILAAKGVGVKQSLEESYKWFALVAKGGDRDAAAKRDEIANSLRPEQLSAARASVELWNPKPLDPESNAVEIPESWQESPGTTAGIDMKKAIGNIQRILNKNGYDAGSADGIMGGKTKTAIVAFQKDNGLDPNGEIDDKLVRALIAKK